MGQSALPLLTCTQCGAIHHTAPGYAQAIQQIILGDVGQLAGQARLSIFTLFAFPADPELRDYNAR
jgi:hypothetical protein